jgi:hypothetical protein
MQMLANLIDYEGCSEEIVGCKHHAFFDRMRVCSEQLYSCDDTDQQTGNQRNPGRASWGADVASGDRNFEPRRVSAVV